MRLPRIVPITVVLTVLLLSEGPVLRRPPHPQAPAVAPPGRNTSAHAAPGPKSPAVEGVGAGAGRLPGGAEVARAVPASSPGAAVGTPGVRQATDPGADGTACAGAPRLTLDPFFTDGLVLQHTAPCLSGRARTLVTLRAWGLTANATPQPPDCRFTVCLPPQVWVHVTNGRCSLNRGGTFE